MKSKSAKTWRELSASGWIHSGRWGLPAVTWSLPPSVPDCALLPALPALSMPTEKRSRPRSSWQRWKALYWRRFLRKYSELPEAASLRWMARPGSMCSGVTLIRRRRWMRARQSSSLMDRTLSWTGATDSRSEPVPWLRKRRANTGSGISLNGAKMQNWVRSKTMVCLHRLSMSFSVFSGLWKTSHATSTAFSTRCGRIVSVCAWSPKF